MHDSFRGLLEVFKETGIQKGDAIVEYIKQGEQASYGVCALVDKLLTETVSECQKTRNK